MFWKPLLLLILAISCFGYAAPLQNTASTFEDVHQIDPDEGKFAVSEGGVLLYASFDNVLQANKANGSQKCMSNQEIQFNSAGVRGKAVRLTEGSVLSFQQKNNINLDRGTVSFWLRAVDWDPARETKNYQWFFSIAGTGAKGGRIQIFKMPSPLLMAFAGKQGSVKEIPFGLSNWGKKQWYFLTLTWETGKCAFYVNGKLIVRVPMQAEELPRDTGNDIRIQSTCGTTDFDELTIYDHALTDGEIENLYLADLPSPDGKPLTYSPKLELGRAMVTPVIDGIIQEEEWNDGVSMEGFLSIPELVMVDYKTSIRAKYDNQAVYFCFETALEPGNYPKASTVDLQTLWLVPSAEILFQTGTDAKLPVYQIAFNMHGQKLSFIDSRQADWKTDLTCSVENGKWIAELRIRYEDIAVATPENGTTWRFNAGRNFIQPKHFANPVLSLAYGDVASYWDFTFREKPSDTFTIAVDQQNQKLHIQPLTRSDSSQTLRVYIKKLPLELTNLTAQLKTPYATRGMLLFDEKIPVDQYTEYKIPGAGRYLALLETSDSQEQILFRQMFQFIQHDRFHIRPVFFSKQKRMEIIWELNQPLTGDFIMQAQILDDNSQVLTSDSKKFSSREKSGTFSFDMSEWEKLHYRANVNFIQNDVTDQRSFPFQCFYNAQWMGFENKMNLNQKLLSPWIPIRVKDSILETLTQQYTLSASGFPEQITAIGKKLSAAPVSLKFATQASSFENIAPLRWLNKTDSKIEWQVNYQAADCLATLNGQLEFDGMIRYDLKLKPLTNKVKLEKMILTIQLPRKVGKYMLPFAGPYQKWSVLDIPTEIKGEYADAFMPHLWAGDDTAGIAWFAESDEFYFPKSRERVVEIIDTGDEIRMQINMVQIPFDLQKEITYTFGLQATPAKYQPDNWTSTHLASCISTRRTPLLSMGYTTGSEYHQYGGVPYPSKDDERARRFVQNTHSVPQQYALIYATSNGMGGSCPEFQFFEEEWKNPLFCDTWSLAGRGEYHWGTNANSQTLRDFYLWSCYQALDQFSNDGFYYDFATVLGVDNPAGGGGYERDGKRYRTWPVFADRAMRRAIYEMVYDKRGHAVFVYHNYSQIVAPITSFATMILDGEPYQQRTGVIGVKITTDYTKLIPLSRFKTMFGIQFGTVPCLLVKLPDSKTASPEIIQATRTVIALAMPHGVPVWGFYCDIQELNRCTAFQDAFGLDDAHFVPYYSNPDEVTLKPEIPDQLLLSYWRKRDGKLLAVVSNLSDKAYSGKLCFTENSSRVIKPMGSERGISVKSGETFPVSIPAKDYQLFLITLPES